MAWLELRKVCVELALAIFALRFDSRDTDQSMPLLAAYYGLWTLTE